MKPIYLEHPRHGTKVAISEVEAAADEKQGWKRYEPGVVVPSPNPLAVVTPPVQPAAAPAPAGPQVEPKRGPGRPRKAA